MGEITLRPYEQSDIDHFMEWSSSEEVIRRSRIKRFNSRDEAISYLTEVIIPHPCFRAICLDDRPIGFISFTPGSGREIRKGLMSYALGHKYCNRGITTKAVKMLASDVFRVFPGIVRIESWVDVENKASERVLEKAGFIKEGTLRKWILIKGEITDVSLFGLLSSDPIPD